MPLPPNAILFDDPMDPYDRVDFLLTLDGADGMLEAGEGVASYTLTLLAEATALGLTIGTAAYAPSQPNAQSLRFYLEVDSGFQANAAFDGDGVTLGLELSITTDSTPARRRQRTIGVKVAQQ